MKPLSASLPGVISRVATVTSDQIKAIRTLQRRMGLTDDDYRALLMAEAGVASTKALSVSSAGRVLDRLNGLVPREATGARPANGRKGGRRPSETMSGLFAGVLRALWLSAYNLGIVENRDDRALIAFCERQTKIAHPRFLQAGPDAAKAIEALKAMITREAGVQWPRKSDVRATKIAIVEAQMAMMDSFDVSLLDERPDYISRWMRDGSMTDTEIDKLQARLGETLRAAKARPA
jgi:hypothetical protein